MASVDDTAGLGKGLPTSAMRLLIRTIYILVGLALHIGSVSAVDAASISRRSANSEWWPQVESIDAYLRNGEWEYGRNSASKLADTILNQTWDDPELESILAEIAFYQAVANANLDLRDQAVWDWHTALNLDRWIAARDLEPYGMAAQLFVEFPLRRLGEMSNQFEQRDPAIFDSATIPTAPNIPLPTLFNTSGALREGSNSFRVEVVVDRVGALHQPVVISKHLHPVVVYACLDWLRDLPKFEPAQLGGDSIDILYPLEIDLSIKTLGSVTPVQEESP